MLDLSIMSSPVTKSSDSESNNVERDFNQFLQSSTMVTVPSSPLSPPSAPIAHRTAAEQTLAQPQALPSTSTSSSECCLQQSVDSPVTGITSQRRAMPSNSPLSASTGACFQQTSYEHMGALIGERMASLLLGPPLHLATLMLRIAANFANGARIKDGNGTGWRRRGEWQKTSRHIRVLQ